MKLKKLLIIITVITVVIIAIYATLRYLFYKGIIEKTKIINFISDWWWKVLIAIIIILIIYSAYKYLKNNKPKTTEKEAPKELVDIEPALKVFQEEFIKGTNISYIIEHTDSKKYNILPANPKNIKIQNTHRFSHPKTGNDIISFEIIALEGTHYGCNFCIIKLDQNLESIRKNWRAILKETTTEESFNFNDKDRPIDTPQSDKMKLALWEREKREEGYSTEELGWLDNMKQPKETEEKKEEEEE